MTEVDSLCFTIPGAARGKGRPRATTRGGRARMFTDAKTASYENLVKLSAQAALAGRRPFGAAVSMVVNITMTPPVSASRKARIAMLSGEQRPAKKPDLDNVVKAVMDGCNGIAFTDDALVVSLQASKRYADEAGVFVRIAPIPWPIK